MWAWRQQHCTGGQGNFEDRKQNSIKDMSKPGMAVDKYFTTLPLFLSCMEFKLLMYVHRHIIVCCCT